MAYHVYSLTESCNNQWQILLGSSIKSLILMSQQHADCIRDHCIWTYLYISAKETTLKNTHSPQAHASQKEWTPKGVNT